MTYRRLLSVKYAAPGKRASLTIVEITETIMLHVPDVTDVFRCTVQVDKAHVLFANS